MCARTWHSLDQVRYYKESETEMETWIGTGRWREREEEDIKLGWGELERESGTTRTCLTHVWNSQRTVNRLRGHAVGRNREGMNLE